MTKKSKQPMDDKWRQFSEEMEENEEPIAPSAPEEALHPEKGLEFPSREKLENQLLAREKQVDEYKDKMVRTLAEMENLRRRAERDVSNAHKFGSERLMTDLLPVVDSLIRALDSPESQDPHAQGMRAGIGLTLDLLYKTLAKHGVTIIDPQKGEPFNPEQHEAMVMQPDPSVPSNTILQVVQKGFVLHGRVLRAAMVIVAS